MSAPNCKRKRVRLEVYLSSENGKAFGKRFLAWASSHGLDWQEGKDIIQDVLAELVKKGIKHVPDEPLLFFMGMQRALKLLAKKMRRREVPLEVDPPIRNEVYNASFEALMEAIAALPEPDRLLVLGWHFEDRTQAEFAAKFDVCQGQISRWISQARVRLRQKLITLIQEKGLDLDDFLR